MCVSSFLLSHCIIHITAPLFTHFVRVRFYFQKFCWFNLIVFPSSNLLFALICVILQLLLFLLCQRLQLSFIYRSHILVLFTSCCYLSIYQCYCLYINSRTSSVVPCIHMQCSSYAMAFCLTMRVTWLLFVHMCECACACEC